MSASSTIRSTFAVLAMLLATASAHAQLFRAYVASDGNDANPCTLPQPCRLLPAALNAVASGGEIWMLDSANFNASSVSVSKSVTILAVPGALGSLVDNVGPALSIAGTGVKVALRNLVIVPLPGATAASGIEMTDGSELTVENCLLANHAFYGIVVSTAANVRISDTTIRNSGLDGVSLVNGASGTLTHVLINGSGRDGLSVTGTAVGTTTTAAIADSTLSDNTMHGVKAFSSNASAVVNVSVHDSRSVKNGDGLYAQSNAGALVSLSASNSLLAKNGSGMAASGSGVKAWAKGNTVNDNSIGFLNNAAVFESAGDNAVRNNGTDMFGTVTVIARS
jgi:hypothetical protein